MEGMRNCSSYSTVVATHLLNVFVLGAVSALEDVSSLGLACLGLEPCGPLFPRTRARVLGHPTASECSQERWEWCRGEEISVGGG